MRVHNPAHTDWFRIYEIHIFTSVNMICYIPSYLLGKPAKFLASCIELPAADEVGQILFAFFMKTVKQIVLAVKSKRLCSDGESHDFKIREFRNKPTTRDISEFVYTVTGEFLADSKDSNEISNEVAHTKNIGDFVLFTFNLLIFSEMCNFFIYKYLKN